MKEFYSHGKLLLSGEYLVLDGALSLALPTRLGQWLRIREGKIPGISWVSHAPDGKVWFKTHFHPEELSGPLKEGSFPPEIRDRLIFMLKTARTLNPGFLAGQVMLEAETLLEFPREWGLGSSSTLISNLGYWAGVDPFTLLEKTMGGSGYDIAAARQQGPLFYQLNGTGIQCITDTQFSPSFKEQLFFVYLNQKQDSRKGISHYDSLCFDRKKAVSQVSEITRKMAEATDISTFRSALDDHETLLSGILGIPPVKLKRFSDYKGSIKSLGAWGGDFILVTGTQEAQEYFREKGYHTIIPYRKMILPI